MIPQTKVLVFITLSLISLVFSTDELKFLSEKTNLPKLQTVSDFDGYTFSIQWGSKKKIYF